MLIHQLYGKNCDKNIIKERYDNIEDLHCKQFKNNKISFFSSSGRLEIIGNHTDHNNGKVITAATTSDIVAAVSISNNDTITIFSLGYRNIVVNINELEPVIYERYTSTALVRGVVAGAVKMGFKVGGFNATINSDLFKGAGVSSSAAFELLIIKIISYLFNEDKLTQLQLAQIAQNSENEYFYKPCGLLDQCAVAFGGLIYIDFFDTLNPVVTRLRNLDSSNQMVLIKTKGEHSKFTDEYAKIRTDMKSVAEFFNVSVLRQVEYEHFRSSIKQLIEKVSGRAILRANHYFSENIRVDKCAAAINNNDYKLFYDCINESGLSSFIQLQNCYKSTDLSQPIPLALMTARLIDNNCIARVHGGGFFGTVLCFVSNDKIENFTGQMRDIYGKNNVMECNIRQLGVCKVDYNELFI